MATKRHDKVLALGRLKAGQMNKTEARYAAYLETQKIIGKVEWFEFEPITLKLAKRTTYTPDFLVMLPDGSLEVHEVKGYWHDDARIKVKVAAEKFPFRFVAVYWESKRREWKFEEF